MTENSCQSKPSEIPIANNFKSLQAIWWYPQWNGGVNHSVSFINDGFTANNITNIILQVSMVAITAYGIDLCAFWRY